jgi:large subunit ribosomal protein L6
MSRIGEKLIQVPSGVTVTIEPNNMVHVKGPKGTLSQDISQELVINQEDQIIKITRDTNDYKVRGLHGLSRTLIDNMIVGVTQQHHKTLELHGVGFRVQKAGGGLTLSVGYSHPVEIDGVSGIDFEVGADEKTRIQFIKVSGIDKQKVGQVAADIRAVRKPDKYKGKGVRYQGEVIKLKAGKKAAK